MSDKNAVEDRTTWATGGGLGFGVMVTSILGTFGRILASHQGIAACTTL